MGRPPRKLSRQARRVHPLIKRVGFERHRFGRSCLHFGSWLQLVALAFCRPRGAVEGKVPDGTPQILRNASLIYRFLRRGLFREPLGCTLVPGESRY